MVIMKDDCISQADAHHKEFGSFFGCITASDRPWDEAAEEACFCIWVDSAQRRIAQLISQSISAL